MAALPSKTPNSLQISPSTKNLFSPSSSRNLKELAYALLLSLIKQGGLSLSKLKAAIVKLFRENNAAQRLFFSKSARKKNRNMKMFLGSFRLHYNWCSSHVVPAPAESCLLRLPSLKEDNNPDTQLEKYLFWLEEGVDRKDCDDIDRLAEVFIKNCHEKFILEKQESYRKWQELNAKTPGSQGSWRYS